jgi:acyl carrier protein
MTVEGMEQKVKEIILEILDVEEDQIVPEARFIDDLDATSIDLVEIVTGMQNTFNVDIDDEQAAKLETVGQAIEFLKQNAGS